MEDNLLDKTCQAVTKKGTPCRNKPVTGSDYCARHQPESRVDADTLVSTPVLELAQANTSIETSTARPKAVKSRYFKFLTKPVACTTAVLLLVFACCCGLISGIGCGLISGIGSTAWLYEAVEGPYYYTQVVVTEFVVTQVVISEAPRSPAPTYTHYPTYTPLETPEPSATQEPFPPFEPTPTVEQPATSTTAGREDLIIDAPEILDSPAQEAEGLLGAPIEIFALATREAEEAPDGGEARTYQIGKYTLEVIYDNNGIAKGLQVLEGLAEDGYSLDQWELVLRRIGMENPGPPDVEARAERRWTDYFGYAITVAANKPGGIVWTVRIYRIPE